MIGIPEGLTSEPLEPPFRKKPQPVTPTRALQFPVGSTSVNSADCTDAPVPLQNLLTKVAGVGAEAPFVYAPIRTKGETPRRDFETTPATEEYTGQKAVLDGEGGTFDEVAMKRAGAPA